MDYFDYQEDELFAEEVPVAKIAEQFGTPTYVYSRATLERHWRAFDEALGEHPHLICYAVKANSNLAVLNVLAKLGSGFDIVSRGELERVLKAGGQADKVVFSGVGKQSHEIKHALEVGIHCFNVESKEELEEINAIASAMNCEAPVSFRINPDVDAKTHPSISTGLKKNKFGIDVEEALALYTRAAELSNVDIVGMDCHIGSQVTELAPFLEALDRLIVLIQELESQNIKIKHLDLGGGLGVRYRNETPPLPQDQASALLSRLRERGVGQLKILLEPGRAIAANAGILLSQVISTKEKSNKNFAVIDAAMNDLMRPALYGAYHEIVPVKKCDNSYAKIYDVVGPVCETTDCFGEDRELAPLRGDLIAIRSTGAYGFTLSSNYNTRMRAAEVMVDGDKAHLVRRRETMDDLLSLEALLPA